MKITSIKNNLNFGKTPVATCMVKEKSTQKDIPATIFRMDPLNEGDYKEIKFSKFTQAIKYGVNEERAQGPYGRGREFYLVKANKNGEVIACAQTLHRYRTGNVPYEGLSTMLEETSENRKFDNGALPLVGYIAQRAADRYDNSVISITGTDEEPTIQKRLKFKETETDGVYALSKRRFTNFINKAKNEANLEIIV